MIQSKKRITNYVSVIMAMLALSIQLSAQSGADCNTDYTLDFSDAENEWYFNALSGSFTVGAQTFDIAVSDPDDILSSTENSDGGLEIRINPHDKQDIVTITYTLSETANRVSFPIVDLDRKFNSSNQQEQVCVLGFLGGNPVPIIPMITSLDGSVDVDGNCAIATTNSAVSGQDESVLVEFDECIDRVVIAYGNGPDAPQDPTSSRIVIGETIGFTSNVCMECDENCTSENVLDFTESGIEWIDATTSGAYTVGTQTYTINIADDDGILETNEEDGPFSRESDEGIRIGINPHSRDDEVVACYALSEVSNSVFFKIRDLDKKSGGNSNQQEQVCVYGTLDGDPTIISPILTSFDGSVAISQTADGIGCATATTNSAISGREESVLVEFDQCIDKIFIVYGSGPMAPDNPTFSNIFIGEDFGFFTAVCGEGCATTCEANAGTLTLDGDSSDVCILGGGGEVAATPNGDMNVPAGFEVAYVLTLGSGLVIEAVSASPSFIIEESGDYTIHTLVYDPTTLDVADIELGVTTGGEVNNLLIQGGGDICASLDLVGASFNADMPRTGILAPDVAAFCTDGGTGTVISATPSGTLSVPTDYQVIYVLTSGNGFVIEAVNAIPQFMVSGMGRYTIHTLVFDPTTLNLADIDFGTTTGSEINALLVQGGGSVCGALDITGAVFNVQDVNAGTLTLNGDNFVCIADGGEVSATPNADALIPGNYQVMYLLTQGNDLVIVDTNVSPSFAISESGTYGIHTLVFDPTTLTISDIELGVTTASEANSLLIQGGGDICAALDLAGARFTAEVLSTGILTPVGTSSICSSGTSTTLTAAPNGEAVIPAGYQLAYVLTSGNGLVIEATSATPEFMVSGTGIFTIHTLVFDPTTLDVDAIEPGISTGFEVDAMLTQGGGDICGALDVAGASFVIENPSAGQITPNATAAICSNSGVAIPLEGNPLGNAIVPMGYQLVYVLTSGSDLVIQEVNMILPQFSVTDNGIYTIHTLVFNPNTLNLNDVEIGVTTGGDINAMLVQGGGNICAALDVAGAGFELVTCIVDNDLDDDGISNLQEGNGIDPSADADNDGLPNYEDPDFPGFIDDNNDGINDMFDQDLDGIADIFDLDSDNDGVADIIEAGGPDANGDGLVDNFVDADGDGWTDIYDTDDDTTPELNDGTGIALPNEDSDGDGLPNTVDLDSDSDGIPDIIEAGGMDANGDGLIDNTTDSDADGYADMVDTDNNNIAGPNDGGTALPSPDADGDGRIDALDLDSDNDGIADIAEAGGMDTNGDGQLDVLLDTDNDGLANLVDTGDGGTALPNQDSDRDGLPDTRDLDSDNDGVADIIEAGGMDANGDGFIDNTADIDGDGFADMVDTDNNNIIGSDDGGTALPNDDTDGDGLPNAVDLDSDNDGIADIIEAGGRDTNGDGSIDNTIDADGDGYVDIVDTDNNNIAGPDDGGTALPSPDSDDDGSTDGLDLDSDNDGLSDLSEAGGQDTNSDGQLDMILDTDGDGYADIVDTDNNNIAGPDDGGTALPNADLDGDGLSACIDLDSDNDGLSDLSESIGDPDIIATIDSDDNGTISGMDMDSDGIIDGMFDNDMNLFGGSLTMAMDADGDLIPNHLDIDSDGDGIVDITEGQPTLSFFIPLEGADADTDKDGLNDAFDSNIGGRGGFAITAIDTDNDGTPDYLDLNSDNDDEPDSIEGFDLNGDGIPNLPLSGMPGDPDNDGLDGIYDEETQIFDPTNNGTYANELANADGGSPERDFRSAFSINIIVNLSGAMLDPFAGNTYFPEMRSTLVNRGLLPGQTLMGLGTPTPAGQPYNAEPWNYTGTEGAGWTDAEYEQITAFSGRQIVDWVLVSFRRSIARDSRVARFAGLVLEDGRVIFLEDIDLSAEEELYIIVEHRNHMGVMTPEPIPVNQGRMFFNFTLSDSYVGPNPDNPLGAGQLEVIPGIFALYSSDGEQILDATQASNPSYNLTGADKTVWQAQNGLFGIYQAGDYNMNGDTNGADLIPFEIFNGVFSVVPR